MLRSWLFPLLLCSCFLWGGLPRLATAHDDPDTEVARRHFRKGADYYERTEYAKALEEFEAARRVKPLPALDFNIARCLDRLERYADAVKAYERFVSGTPDPKDAKEARQRIEVLKSRVGASSADGEVNRKLEEGIALFNAGKPTEARAVFLPLPTLAPEKPDPYRWLSMTYARLGQCDEAAANLDRFLERVSPNDPLIADVLAQVERCRADSAAQTGTFAVASTPSGAEVALDDARGAALGKTPYRSAAVETGEHMLYIRKAGFQTLAKKISVAPHETVSLDLTLQPLPSPVRPYIAPIVVGVAALGLAASGVGLVASVGPDYRHLRDTCAPFCAPDSYSGLETRANVGYALLAAGGAAAAVDIALFVLAARKARPERHVWLAPAGRGLVLSGAF